MRKSIGFYSLICLLLGGLSSCTLEPESFLLLSPNQASVPSQGDTITINVSCNADWQVTGTTSWCHAEPAMGSGSGSFLLIIEANPNLEDRRLTVEVTAPGVSRPMVIWQMPRLDDNIFVNVPVAGGLEVALESKNLNIIKKITITGYLDTKDFEFMRDKLAALQEVDITGASLYQNRIPDWAFYRSTYYNRTLQKISFPASLEEIGQYAFFGCSGLSMPLSLPESLKYIGAYAFSGCAKLTGNFVFPPFMTKIAEGAFLGCTGMTGTLSLPESITSIGRYAFDGCTGIAGEISLGSKVTAIDFRAFYAMPKVTSVRIAAVDPPLIEGDIFASGMMVFVPSGSRAVYVSASRWGNYIIIDNSTLISVTVVAGGLEQAVKAAAADPAGVSRLAINGSLNDQDFAFMKQQMPLLTFVDLSQTNVAAIPVEAFKNSKTLREIRFPSTLKRIDTSAFESCVYLSAMTLPVSLEYIEARAFFGCKALSQIILPKYLIYIGSYAFYGCTGAKGTLEIPMTVEMLKDNAFRECPGLEYLVINETLDKIGDYAFAYCSGLKSITCKRPVPPVLGTSALFGIDKVDCILYVPLAYVYAYRSSSYWMSFLQIEAIK